MSYSATMNGENLNVLVNTRLDEPTGLAIDYFMDNRIYWCDEKLNLIETIKPDGTDRRQIRHNLMNNPYKIDIFESHIYWLLRSAGTVGRIDKFGRGAVLNYVQGLDNAEDLKVFHKHKYPTQGLYIFHKTYIFLTVVSYFSF